jgi:hypothetical protein
MRFAIWRRLDGPGHDAARVTRDDAGWRLEGTAVFVHEDAPALLSYALDLHPSWATRSARIRGFLGATTVDVSIVRDDEGWTFDGVRVEGLAHLHDLDLQFTPATNLNHLSRAALQPRQSASIPVAWFQPGVDTLVELSQHYRCRDAFTFDYDASSVGYRETLRLASTGFVDDYPGLWQLERTGSR